jgi:glycosyltransferase involved in cell wall biosynthesis
MLKTRPNVLFVSPQKLDSNTGYHIQWYASQLASLGARCVIAVPQELVGNQVPCVPTVSYAYALQAEPTELFRNGHVVDVMYAWTPRECVRRFAQRLLSSTPCRLVIHFEDNEEYLTECSTKKSISYLKEQAADKLDKLIPLDRYHPVRGSAFVQQADGMSFLIDSLRRFNLRNVADVIISAPVDQNLFYEKPINYAYRRHLGLPVNECVITYSGNVHDANLSDVMELYEAVQLLNTEGVSTTLLRTGTDTSVIREVLGKYSKVINLGWVDRDKIPEVLACADIFIQPGGPGPFNDQRIPSKFPEFFAIGRPIVLGRTNIGLRVQNGLEAMVLGNVTAISIANAVKEIVSDQGLLNKLTLGACHFYNTKLRADPQAMTGLIHDVLRIKRPLEPDARYQLP